MKLKPKEVKELAKKLPSQKVAGTEFKPMYSPSESLLSTTKLS